MKITELVQVYLLGRCWEGGRGEKHIRGSDRSETSVIVPILCCISWQTKANLNNISSLYRGVRQLLLAGHNESSSVWSFVELGWELSTVFDESRTMALCTIFNASRFGCFLSIQNYVHVISHFQIYDLLLMWLAFITRCVFLSCI